jgi:hypothetical protein
MSSPTIALHVSWQELKLIHVALCQARIGAARKGEDRKALEELSQRVAGLRLDLVGVPSKRPLPPQAAGTSPASGGSNDGHVPALTDRGRMILEAVVSPILRRPKS